MQKLSPDYYKCLDEARAHHARSKTYSGKLVRPQWEYIGGLIARLGCKSVLDYGCGKGQQYKWINFRNGLTLEQHWGVEVTKYDPAWPAFAQEPTGKFDLVICSHVLGSIPLTDLPAIVDRLYAFSVKALFVVEKLGPVLKRVFSDDTMLPRNWGADEWRRALSRTGSGLEVILTTTERKEGMRKLFMTRYTL